MRQMNRLSARQIANTRRPGKLFDGAGLILRISPEGHKTFAFQYMRGGKSRCMGLGSVAGTSLALARELAAEARAQLARGLDPLDERTKARAAQRAAAARLITVREAAGRF